MRRHPSHGLHHRRDGGLVVMMEPIKFPPRTVVWGLEEYAGVFIYAAIGVGGAVFFAWITGAWL